MHQVQPVFQASEGLKMYFFMLMKFEKSILISYSFFGVFGLDWCQPAARKPHLVTPLLPILYKAGKEIRWQKLMTQDEDREIAYQLALGKNRLLFGKINILLIKRDLGSEE